MLTWILNQNVPYCLKCLRLRRPIAQTLLSNPMALDLSPHPPSLNFSPNKTQQLPHLNRQKANFNSTPYTFLLKMTNPMANQVFSQNGVLIQILLLLHINVGRQTCRLKVQVNSE